MAFMMPVVRSNWEVLSDSGKYRSSKKGGRQVKIRTPLTFLLNSVDFGFHLFLGKKNNLSGFTR